MIYFYQIFVCSHSLVHVEFTTFNAEIDEQSPESTQLQHGYTDWILEP